MQAKWDHLILLVAILAAEVISTSAQECGENRSFSYE
jgi:hypothetical protein